VANPTIDSLGFARSPLHLTGIFIWSAAFDVAVPFLSLRLPPAFKT
jgi:hypothetical protein